MADGSLRIENLTKRFNDEIVLNGVSLRVKAGRITSLIGPNGAGKSTIFSIIAGLIRAEEGAIFLNGRDISARSPRTIVRSGISYLMQEYSVFPQLTVLENVMLGFKRQSGESLLRLVFTWAYSGEMEARYRKTALDLLRAFNLENLSFRKAGCLSFGEQRKLAFARLNATDADLLLLDEPTAGLDPAAICEIVFAIRSLKERGKTVLLIEHNMDFVNQISDYIYVLHRGQIIAQGLPNEVKRESKVMAAYLGH
jgi:ABC-type branched-subunit amino acid transport system ATPase component